MDVTILLGSKSDMPVAEKCTKILEQFGVSYQLRVASAHRSPAFVEQIVHDAEADGCTVFIAMAGLAAALKQNKLDQIERVKKMDAEVNGRDA